ncbi:hypothetical protein GCM10007890_52390 [Methylobacterium tardum]|uniref:Uncharacterized protein n=1 Tax=Methylobacterium tardum TaxID=374432 RepID=A0AA37WUJ2_9HYPH|nr:hypothetical protein GCM10007890_52390 [Methylobacterium tardum]
MNEDDSHGLLDPLWYDRAEPDEPPGLFLNAAAYLFLLLMTGFRVGVHVYWLPDQLWCWASDRIRRNLTAGH